MLQRLFKQLWFQILIGLLIGIVLGFVLRQLLAPESQESWLSVFTVGADLFLRMLKMCVVPLVASSLFLGVANISNLKSLGNLGGKTGLYYIFSSLLAITVGMFFVNLISPGKGAVIDLGEYSTKTLEKSSAGLGDLLTRVVPVNPLDAMSSSPPDMLGLIFFTIIFAVFSLKLPKQKKDLLVSLADSIFEVMIKIVELVIRLAPIAILFLVAKLVITSDPKVFVDLAWYLVTVTLALLAHLFLVLPLVYFLMTRKNPYAFMGQMAPALLTAFSSASSAATLPLTMDCAEKNGRVPNSIASMVLPLGATVNMDGTALYEGVAVLFIAQVMGVDLTLMQQLTVFATALMVSIGAAGIPHAGLVMMVIILEAVGLPSEAIGVIFAVDRVVDMTRTVVNVWSDSVGAAIIADKTPIGTLN